MSMGFHGACMSKTTCFLFAKLFGRQTTPEPELQSESAGAAEKNRQTASQSRAIKVRHQRQACACVLNIEPEQVWERRGVEERTTLGPNQRAGGCGGGSAVRHCRQALLPKRKESRGNDRGAEEEAAGGQKPESEQFRRPYLAALPVPAADGAAPLTGQGRGGMRSPY